MPRGNGTGPMGMGPLTGRGMGYCAGFSAPGYAAPAGCAGAGGFGRGRRRMFFAIGMPKPMRFGYPAHAPEYEAAGGEQAALEKQARYLKEQLDFVKRRLSDMKDED